jgi:acetyl esterase/lipase
MLPNARYAVASVGYRLSQQAKFPAQIEDSKAAVRWLRANAGTYRLDPNRFAAWGESAGGHLAALLGVADGKFDLGENATVPSRVQAVVAFGAPVDLWRMGPGSLASDSAESQLVGGPLGENELVAARASPLRYVDGRDPPFLIVHAERDGQVPMEHARWLEAALRNVGVAATLHIAGGADPRSDAAVADAVRAFLERTIGR